MDNTSGEVTETHDDSDEFRTSVLTPAENKWWHAYAPLDAESAVKEAWARSEVEKSDGALFKWDKDVVLDRLAQAVATYKRGEASSSASSGVTANGKLAGRVVVKDEPHSPDAKRLFKALVNNNDPIDLCSPSPKQARVSTFDDPEHDAMDDLKDDS